MAADKDGSGVLEPNEIKDLIRKVCERDKKHKEKILVGILKYILY
jgi:hypothetical protein